ncbi:MAG: VacJ family lipoprotein [Deltaproteobacteria bacterium]|nr:VacJ family lipoprotein [Deltaproteobacteria bacterium]MBW2070448.1 VacJ family lipoprotein [Deltaproteobacteria bacterium]
MLMVLLVGFLGYGCASTPVQKEPEIPPKRPVSEFVKKGVKYPIDAYDPWEGMNRRIYIFNALFDQYVFLPIVRGYEFITPDFTQKGVSNFYNNVHEITTLINSLLQFKMQKFGITLSRILLNTTIGAAGLLDVSTALEIRKQNEDFGQTLGFYGMGPGPYLVLPVFGPSSLRDAGGLAVDVVSYSYITGAVMDEADLNWQIQLGVTVLDAIDTRHQQSFRYYATGTPFEYELIRMLYLRKREFEVEH